MAPKKSLTSSSSAAAAEAGSEGVATNEAPCQRQPLRRASPVARALVASVAAAAVAVVSLLVVALPSIATDGARDLRFSSVDSPAALVWQIKKFSGRAVLSETFLSSLSSSSSAAAAAAAALLSPPSTRRAAAEGRGGRGEELFSSFLSPVEEFDEESARLGVEPFSSLAAETVAALSSPPSSPSPGSSPLPAGLWHLDRLDSRALPLDGAPFNPARAGFPRRGEGVTIYVVDSGVSVSHSEFLGAGSGRGGGSRASEGPDFSGAGGAPSPPPGSDASSFPPLLGDCDGHGTHVASLAAGTNVGVAPGARVVSLRVLGCDGAGRASSLVAALRHVAREGARPAVVVLSLGGGDGGGAGSGAGRGGGGGGGARGVGGGASASAAAAERAAAAIDAAALEALEAGAVIVAAAGNAGGDACASSPGRLPGIITVAGSDLPLGDKFPSRFRRKGTAAATASPAAAAAVPPAPARSDGDSGGGGGGGALGQILSEASISSPFSSSPSSSSSSSSSSSPDSLYPFSNTGPCVTLFAPGADLLAACGGGAGASRRCPDPALPSAAAWSSGTSMSAPLVAGAAALILAERPDATPAEVRAELVSRATEGPLDFSSSGKPGVLPGTPNRMLYLGPV